MTVGDFKTYVGGNEMSVGENEMGVGNFKTYVADFQMNGGDKISVVS